jgi:hypothetical protein
MDIASLEYLANKSKEDFIVMLKKVWTKGKEYRRDYGDNDFRVDFFIVFSELVLWTIAQLENFHELYPHNKIDKYMQLKRSSKAQLLSQFDTINRCAFILEAMFCVEHFISAIACSLNINSGGGYKSTIDNLCNKLFGSDNSKSNILYAPYLLRNSLHNNGYIRILKEDFEISVGVKKYAFKKNEQITCGGWDNLCILVNLLLDTLMEIIDHDQVKKLGIFRILI